MQAYERKRFIKLAVAVMTAVIAIMQLGCNSSLPTDETQEEDLPENAFTVEYLDVGMGDAILIGFPDDKTMLIDFGESNNTNAIYIKSRIKALGGKLSYIVVSHPDSDHVGNAKSIIENFDIERAFVPYLLNTSKFGVYDEVYQYLKSKITIEYSTVGKKIAGEDYFVAFLYPEDVRDDDGIYSQVNLSPNPSSDAINALSPIIYVECYGRRFLFTGDSPASTERKIIEDYTSTVYDRYFGAGKVNLEDIDFLKVAHHGSEDASCEEFLDLLKPKNAVICVGNNSYGHPSSATVNRLVDCNADIGFFRTDQDGTVRVVVDEEGKINVFCSIN